MPNKNYLLKRIEFHYSLFTNNQRYTLNGYLNKKVIETIDTMTKEMLNGVDTAIIKGTLAVAENGAVWLYESQMINRLLPFICQHLIILIDRKNIVATLHQAYQKIDSSNEGFGVFIAGPSKTANIEQSLVIGAHGAKSLIIYIA